MSDRAAERSSSASGGRARGRAGRPASFRQRHPGVVRGVLLALTFVLAAGFGAAYGAWALVCRGGACPAIESLEGYTPRQTSKLFAADGRFVAEIGNERRTLVKLQDIPPVVREAFLTVEDKRFYSHGGIDWMRVPGATIRNIRTRSWKEGFSTITMQLARNVFPEDLTREKSLVRKLREAKVAREIEHRYEKDRILELYLNQIYLGAGAYGVETASQRYFGKSVRELNLAEAALLAALPKGPERYNPRRYPDRAIQRRNTVVELMRREGHVSGADASLARAYPLQLASKTESGETAPYFVEWVRRQMEEKFGRQLYEDGLKVYTTLDVEAQQAAERAVEQQLRAIENGRFGPFKHLTYEQYVARATGDDRGAGANSPYLQAAFVAMDPRSGAVRALVGGRDFDDSKFNRATQALRQPGSTFKPIVYAAAVQNGRPPSYVVDDAPVSVPQADGSEWTPQNYDMRFMGPMTMRRGLYLSRNLIAIRTGMELGPQTVIEEARRFGITTPIPPYPSIYLGSADVYPIELIASYSTFATLGVRSTPFAIVRVENARGDVLWEPAPRQDTVMSAEEAWLMVDMMRDVVRHGTAYNAVWDAGFQHPSAGKTGTTNDGTDVWFVGYTPDLVAGVWMGFDRPKKIKANAQGGELAAPAWTAFMREVYRRRPAPPDWPMPAGIVARQMVAGTAHLAGPACFGAPTVTEFFVSGTEPYEECAPGEGLTVAGDSLGTDSLATPGAYGAEPRTPYGLDPGAEDRPVPRPTVPLPGDDSVPLGTTTSRPRPARRPAPRDSTAGAPARLVLPRAGTAAPARPTVPTPRR